MTDLKFTKIRKSGLPCGILEEQNATVVGSLTHFCRERFMPDVSCYDNCPACVQHGGAWCPSGRVRSWVSGVKSNLDTDGGFCWHGGLFWFSQTRLQVFFRKYGTVELEVECYSIVPMYGQCTLRGEWLFASIVTALLAFSFLCSCVFCRKVYEADSRPPPGPPYGGRSSTERGGR